MKIQSTEKIGKEIKKTEKIFYHLFCFCKWYCIWTRCVVSKMSQTNALRGSRERCRRVRMMKGCLF